MIAVPGLERTVVRTGQHDDALMSGKKAGRTVNGIELSELPVDEKVHLAPGVNSMARIPYRESIRIRERAAIVLRGVGRVKGGQMYPERLAPPFGRRRSGQ